MGGVGWAGPRRVGGAGRHLQTVCSPRQHLHRLAEHLEGALPVAAVGVAVEEHPVERSPQCQVILGLCGDKGSGSQDVFRLLPTPEASSPGRAVPVPQGATLHSGVRCPRGTQTPS